MEAFHRYDDIINLPHPVSKKHPQMPLTDRAAQFAPFAALTGYDAAIAETGRYTDQKKELSEEQKQIISEQLHDLQQHIRDDPVVSVVFFKEDERKAGGAYSTVTGVLKKIDEYSERLVFTDGTAVPFSDILSIEEENEPEE